MSYEINFAENEEYIGIYGVEFNGSNPGKRLYDARYLKFRKFKPSSTTTAGYDAFIKTTDSPFAIKEVVTKYNTSTGKQEVLAYEGDDNWSSAISDSNHNRMIEFPKFYYKRPSQFRWEVSTTQHPGFKPSPMHYRNGVMHDKVWVSKYRVNSSYLSQSGQVPVTNGSHTTDGSGYTITKFRNEFRSRGCYVWDYATQCSINMLMFVKYATMNIQSLIGLGWSSTPGITADNLANTGKINTGGSDSVKGKDGYSGATVNTNAAIVAMGIDNYWGNIWTFCDGMVMGNSGGNKVYINTDIEHITANPSLSNLGGYSLVGTNAATSTGTDAFSWISNSMAYDSNVDWAQYPTSTVGVNTVSTNNNTNNRRLYSQSNYFINDGYWMYKSDGTNLHVCLNGGDWAAGFACGPLCLAAYSPLAFAYAYVGASAIVLP